MHVPKAIFMPSVSIDASVSVHNPKSFFYLNLDRKFGSSKRMSEVEKKDVQEMIAMKIQVSKDDWKKEIEATKEELEL